MARPLAAIAYTHGYETDDRQIPYVYTALQCNLTDSPKRIVHGPCERLSAKYLHDTHTRWPHGQRPRRGREDPELIVASVAAATTSDVSLWTRYAQLITASLQLADANKYIYAYLQERRVLRTRIRWSVIVARTSADSPVHMPWPNT